jgi:hypothetical protein
MKMFVKLLICSNLLIIVYLFFLFSQFGLVFAQEQKLTCKNNPYLEPKDCGEAGVTIDSNCQARRILNPNPNEDCCILVCKNANELITETLDRFSSFNLFGTTYRIDLTNRANIEMLINLAIITIISIAGLYALFRGAYLAGFVLPSSEKDEDFSKISKELRNLVFGFLLAVGSIVIVQLAFTVLGLGSLTDIQLFEDKNGINIVVGNK